MQLIDQAIGLLTVSQVDVHQATSGVRSDTRRTASAVVAAGPATSAPHDDLQAGHLQARPDVPGILDYEDP